MGKKSIVIGVVLALTVLISSPALAEDGGGCGCGPEGGDVIQGVLQFGGDIWDGLMDSIGSLFGGETEDFGEYPRAESSDPKEEFQEYDKWFDSTNW